MRGGLGKWIWVVAVLTLLAGAACSGSSAPGDASSTAASTAGATAASAGLAEATTAATQPPAPAGTAAPNTSTATAVPTQAPAPAATAAPQPTATAQPAPAGTVDTTGWVKLGAIDSDISHGLLDEADLDSSWTLQDSVDNSLVVGITQLACDGKTMTPPANPTQHAAVEFERDSSSLPAPLLIQVNWKLADQGAASNDLDFLTQAFRCSAWNVSGLSYDLRSYTLSTVGDKSAAARLTATINGQERVMTVVAFRSGSVLSEVIYVDSAPADPTELAKIAGSAANRVSGLNL